MSLARHWILVPVGLCVIGCAQHIGRNATQGALEAIRDARLENPSANPAARIGGEVTRGALDELQQPEQLAQLQRIARAAGAAALQGAFQGAQGAIDRAPRGGRGTGGSGPPGVGLVDRISSTAGREAADEFLIEVLGCEANGGRNACVDARLQEWGQRAAIGAIAAIRDSLRVPLLLIGLLLASLNALLVWHAVKGRGRSTI